MMGYVWATLGVLALLAGAWWGVGNGFFPVGDLKSTTFLVQGVSCTSCLTAIRGELLKKPGMVDLTADLAQGLVRIEHRPPLSEESIVRVLADLGYPAKSVQEQAGRTGAAPKATTCSGCGPSGCSATAASWRELFKKIFGSENF